MPIYEGDIKIMASQVLSDDPEAGGAATGVQIIDGVSNNLFPDVGELDRVYGRVFLRKVFANVTTDDRAVFMGAHAIIAEEPEDPSVSCLLFSTNDAFDTRQAAKGRVESYLIQGPAYAGLLFGDHIAGQMTVALLQRENATVPPVGETILLRKAEGLGSEFEQFVRIIDAAVELRTFNDAAGDYVRAVVTLSISDQLGADFPGFPAARSDTVNFVGKTKVYDTNVADAARYFGLKRLTAPVLANSRLLEAEGIFVPLVPSGREEIGVADARMNQQAEALAAGATGTFTQTANVIFTTLKPLFVGGGIMPGSLSVERGGLTLTDVGGKLMDGLIPVGTVDYGGGILALGADLFGAGAASTKVSYVPAAPASMPTESIGLPVTDATRRATWVVSLAPMPTPKSVQVRYRAQGRWYTLSDDGSGAVRGADSTAGAGSLNGSTGTLSITLGALPDVPSSVIVTWASKAVAKPVSPPPVTPGVPTSPVVPPSPPSGTPGRAHKTFNMGQAFVPGSLQVSWGGSVQATDSAASGNIVGGATGTVVPADGLVYLSPNVLPAKGTPISFTFDGGVAQTSAIGAFIDGGSAYTTALAGPIVAGGLALTVSFRHPVRDYGGADKNVDRAEEIRDDGAGKLRMWGRDVGTVNYGTGAVSLVKSFTTDQRADVWSQVSVDGSGNAPFRSAVTGQETRQITVTMLNTGSSARYVKGSAGSVTVAADFDALTVAAPVTPGAAMQSPSFGLGPNRYMSSNGFVLTGPNPFEVGLPAGTASTSGNINLTTWPAGAAPTITNWAAVQTPIEGPTADVVTFATAASPVAPSGFSVQGKFSDTGDTFNVSANPAGHIIGTGVYGRIDYETGVVDLVFGTPAAVENPLGQDFSYLGLPGVTRLVLRPVLADTLRYNAVAYAYLPLDAATLGLDPVRLPSDGRVPIFRRGTVVVVHHTGETAPAAASNGQTVSLGRPDVATVRVIGGDGKTIRTGYTLNRAAGTVTFADVTGYVQPVKISHRIEEAALLADAQISGLLRLNKPLSRAYPAGSKVSSALRIGDMSARVSKMFDQGTWNLAAPVWSDDLQGSAAGPTYDTINYPPEVKNRGTVTERWALVFTASTTFVIIGEHLGQIGVGNIAADCAPINPATGTPFFRLDKLGFNSGWTAGNAIRLNTVGASAPIWAVRVVQQSAATLASDKFSMAVRGNIDTP